MQHHFVVYFDTDLNQWVVDTETTDCKFDRNVWNGYETWEYWNDETSEKLNDLIAIFDKINEENKQ